MITAILLAMTLGGEFESESEIPEDALPIVDEEIDIFTASLVVIIARLLAGTDMEPTIDRLASQVMRVYWFAVLSYAGDQDDVLTWKIDPEKDHCTDCLSQNGISRTRGEWLRMALQDGIYPRSVSLECTGRFCGCQLQ